MNKIALFILYNHHFTKNIDRIEELYKGKFSYIFHLIPFYSGNRENVITVYESSYQFQSYISQAYQQVKKEGFTHYFVVADDMIINPKLNEDNLFEFTGIPEDSAFITDMRDYKSHPYAMPLFARLNKPGVEVVNILPPKNEAINKIEMRGLSVLPTGIYVLKFFVKMLSKGNFNGIVDLLKYLRHRSENISYPLIWGYSDIVLVPHEYMDKFCLYCGCFAGMNLFVEWAIPMSICLSSDKITLGKDIRLKEITQLYNLGKDGQKEFERKYQFSLRRLIDEYPKDVFYIHPLKLSKWI